MKKKVPCGLSEEESFQHIIKCGRTRRPGNKDKVPTGAVDRISRAPPACSKNYGQKETVGYPTVKTMSSMEKEVRRIISEKEFWYFFKLSTEEGE